MTDASTHRMPRWFRARRRYFALAVGTIVLGLAVHWGGDALSPVVRDVLGDALWAAMAAWWIAAAAPAVRLAWRAAVALAFCFAVEFSQLVHSPALDALRRTAGGHLALGSGFDGRDFAAYASGVLAAVLLERAIDNAGRTSPPVFVRSPSTLHPTSAGGDDVKSGPTCPAAPTRRGTCPPAIRSLPPARHPGRSAYSRTSAASLRVLDGLGG